MKIIIFYKTGFNYGKKKYSKISYLNYPPTCCKDINLIVKDCGLKKYNLKYYDSNIKLKKIKHNKNFRLNIQSFIRDVIFDLRPRRSNHIDKKNFIGENISKPF